MKKRTLKQYLLIFIGLCILFEVIRSFYVVHKGMADSKRIIDDSNLSIKSKIDAAIAKQQADTLHLTDSLHIR